MKKMFYYFILCKKNLIIYLSSIIIILYLLSLTKSDYLDKDYIVKIDLFNCLEQSFFLTSFIIIVVSTTSFIIYSCTNKHQLDIMFYNKTNKTSIIINKMNSFIYILCLYVNVILVMLLIVLKEDLHVINLKNIIYLTINYNIYCVCYLLLNFMLYNIFRSSILLIFVIIFYMVAYFVSSDNIINQMLIFDSLDFITISIYNILLLIFLYIINIKIYVKKSLIIR